MAIIMSIWVKGDEKNCNKEHGSMEMEIAH